MPVFSSFGWKAQEPLSRKVMGSISKGHSYINTHKPTRDTEAAGVNKENFDLKRHQFALILHPQLHSLIHTHTHTHTAVVVD